MLCIGIYQESDDVLDRVISSALISCDFDVIHCGNHFMNLPQTCSGHAAAVISGENLDFIKTPLDICVVTQKFNNGAVRTSTGIAVVPETCSAEQINALSPRSVVTYGLCCKNTVTVSSLVENTLVITIQREIVSAFGKRIGEQEFSVSIAEPDEIDLVLTAIAILILADVPVDKIKSLQF